MLDSERLPRGHTIRETPVTERPRERLAQRGPGGLTAAELWPCCGGVARAAGPPWTLRRTPSPRTTA